MTNLLLEIFSEEIPAGMQERAAEKLSQALQKALNETLDGSHIVTHWSTPRRLGFHVENVSSLTAEKTEEVRGPKTSAPEQAVAGFMGKYGSDESKISQKGGHYFFTDTCELHLKDIISDVINSFVWPKSMRWGDSAKTWVRPMKSILCLYGHDVVEVSYDGILASDKTIGHRFMSGSKPFAVKSFADYKSKMESHYVMINHADRKQSIVSQIDEQLKAHGGLKLLEDQGLLSEIAGLVEYPVVHLGKIEEQFMSLPREVLQIALKVHQRYLMLEDLDGNLAPYFVIVSNIKATDGGKSLVHGNEKVLRARLSDAMFFYDLDKKSTLESKLEKLKKVTFHKDIGSVFDKVMDIEKYSAEIAAFMKTDVQKSKIAAKLCKSDLVTEMVKEFPELQGVIGGYYAEHDDLGSDIAAAISDHYKPVGPNDNLPANDLGNVVSIADKLVTLNSLFAINVKPTGSKDPFALRRAANGVIRMVGAERIESFFEFMRGKNLLRPDVEQYIKDRKIL